jgi:hypothetical protein
MNKTKYIIYAFTCDFEVYLLALMNNNLEYREDQKWCADHWRTICT